MSSGTFLSPIQTHKWAFVRMCRCVCKHHSPTHPPLTFFRPEMAPSLHSVRIIHDQFGFVFLILRPAPLPSIAPKQPSWLDVRWLDSHLLFILSSFLRICWFPKKGQLHPQSKRPRFGVQGLPRSYFTNIRQARLPHKQDSWENSIQWVQLSEQCLEHKSALRGLVFVLWR